MSETATKIEGQWFVVQTLSNKEGGVKKYLDKYRVAEEMEEYVFEVLVPTETVTDVRSGKKKQIIRKLYPGYVFIHMRLYDENRKLEQKPWYYVNGADGKEVPKVQYSVGEEVKITDGPFLNLNGRIEEIDPEHGRLKVSVSIFGRFTPVFLEYWQVERVAS